MSKKADEFLKARQADGPVRAPQLFEEAAKQHITGGSLRRAKKRLRILSRFERAKDDRGGSWTWRLAAPPKIRVG